MPKVTKLKAAKERRKYCRCTPICTAKINRKNRIRHYRRAKIPLDEAPPSVTATESGEEESLPMAIGVHNLSVGDQWMNSDGHLGSGSDLEYEGDQVNGSGQDTVDDWEGNGPGHGYGESRMDVDEESDRGAALGDSELEREEFDNGGSEFDNKGSEFDNKGLEFDNECSDFDNEGSEFDNEDSEFDNEGSEFDNEDSEFDNEGSEFDNKVSEFDNKGSEFNNQGLEFDNEGSEFDNEGSEYNEWKEFDEAAEAGLLKDLSDSDILSELDLMLESDMLAADEHEAEEWANRQYLFKDSNVFCNKEVFHQERKT